MRTIVKAIALSIAICAPSGARSDDSTDTLLRAAYCVGVLKASIAQMQQSLSWLGGCDGDHTRAKDSDLQECKRGKEEVAEVAHFFLDDYEQRRRRYAEYLRVRSLSSEHLLDVLLSVMQRGERDTITKSEKISSDSPIFRQHCSGSGDQFADCVAKYDQTYANIVRCQQYPDRLPF